MPRLPDFARRGALTNRQAIAPRNKKTLPRDDSPAAQASIALRVHFRMKPMRRWHDFASGREARRRQYREYYQGARQSPGAKLAPALRVASKIGGVPKRGAGAPLAGMRPRRHAKVPREMARLCPASGSHPSPAGLEPAPPCAGRFVGLVDHIRDMACRVP